MKKITFHGREGAKEYEVDDGHFLLDSGAWDEDFAKGVSAEVGIPEGLTDEHWKVIRFIREYSRQLGECPLLYQTCKANGLLSKDLKRLFPSGYLRGACKLAGITYRERVVNYYGEPGQAFRTEGKGPGRAPAKVYRVDVMGFLVDPAEWDEEYAANRALELNRNRPLIAQHWKLIRFLRDYWEKHQEVPTVHETCELNGLDIPDLEWLFPDGYHRGLVKLSGLRVR